MNNKGLISFNDFDNSKLGKIIVPTTEEALFIKDYIIRSDKFHTVIKCQQMTNFNFYQILNHFIMYADDRLIRATNQPFDDFEVINALVINYLSTAKMFLDVIESFDSLLKNKIHTYTSQRYDENFYYKLMTALRNFSLHGHLPVYLNVDRYSFNLNYILDEGSRFNFSKSAKEAIEEISLKIQEQHQDIANISFSRTIIEYHKVVLEVVNKFFEVNYSTFEEKQNDLDSLLMKYSSLVENDSICIRLDNLLHVINITHTSMETFQNEQQNSKIRLENHMTEFKEIITNY